MIALTDAPRRLKDEFGVRISYRKLYHAAIDGVIPAERGSNGRWLLAEGDLGVIAAALGTPAPAHRPAAA